MSTKKRSLDQHLFDLTNVIQPSRRVWMQTVSTLPFDHGISTSLAIIVLLASRFGPHVQQKTLAIEAGIDAAALVRILDQGEEAGLLVRCDVPNDRRSKAIKLLPKGKRHASKMEATLKDLRFKLMGDVPEEDIETTTRVMRLLEERCQAYLLNGKTDQK
ncbi:MAG: MarR family transcriptional regulator for hemolysin [Cycloclasticus pugetii]|jgi:MarR family transcriptional regulator for hemolysin|nr:MarR family transcriptional regulator, transcriptional regulator for hemolysin [Cycloclasticus pugetii]|tara:strand:+ start:2130 stop:2609 length:480 start_codon:yes stop_codon:yes gene_type:complete